MAKRVSIIDIGSNSIRMVIYEKTSRFAFHLLYEVKSKVRLSQDTYENNGNLQKIPMQRTFDALRDFLCISTSFKVRKTLCVATSALRNAPNKQDFIQKVRKQLDLNIKVITGEKEAYLGAVACANLLPPQHNALSIDIGGGSSELSLINNTTVNDTLSLELGTIRLKELYFDKNNIHDAINFIDKELEKITSVNASKLIGIGGTLRALSIGIMQRKKYPLNKVHAFEYTRMELLEYIALILQANTKELKELGIKKNRFDIIKPGALILQRLLLKHETIKRIITSGVGVREGVFLSDLLRNSKNTFPSNYSTSMRYILDSNVHNSNFSNNIAKVSKIIFHLLQNHLHIDTQYSRELSIASKLFPAGSNIHFYSQNRHSYYLVKSALEYGFTHTQIMLIATLTRYAKNKPTSKKHLKKYEDLLPDERTLHILNYILSLSIALLAHKPRNIDFEISFKEGDLSINSKENLFLSKEAVKKVHTLENLKVIF
ncbi:Ppx/GppA family phosphatase [Sulfurimonas sp. SAG-AH-194-I05]|nr:Ppx/GppA phosphatase family protein [Sulfurimonas sp. SAG-AH-194-I05]MDF1876160.1 Ppx/GppA family phosphatase [Sulfurimonas sp. SAG-AH-194-I05]